MQCTSCQTRNIICVHCYECKMRRLLTLLVLACARAKVLVHFGQATEFGVEQLDKDAGTLNVTFFAAMRQQIEDHEYVLSFGPPQCERNCAQSTNSICKTQERVLNDGWEHIQIDHYPTPEDTGAIYIRKTIDLEAGLACINDDFQQTGEKNFTGTLYLSIAQSCDENSCPHYETVEMYPFNFNADLAGLNYKYTDYEFTAEATRNLRMANVGLFVEITTVLTDRKGEQLSQFTESTILHQTCEPALHIVAITNCSEIEGNVCTQRLYLAPETDDHMIDSVKGELAIQTKLVNAQGGVETISVIHVDVAIASPVDFGMLQRPIDSLFTVLTATYAPYFLGSNTTLLYDKDYFCVSVASPNLDAVTITDVTTCTTEGETCDDDNITSYGLYSLEDPQVNRITMAATVPLEQASQAMVCMNLKKLSDGPQFVQVSYRLDSLTGSSNAKRGVYSGETMSPSLIFCDCPWGYIWDDVTDSCVHHHHDDWHWSWWWVWIVLGILVVGVCVYFVIAGGWHGHEGYDVYIVPTSNPNSFVLREGTQQRIVNVHTEGNNNNVTVNTDRPRHHRRSKRPLVELTDQ